MAGSRHFFNLAGIIIINNLIFRITYDIIEKGISGLRFLTIKSVIISASAGLLVLLLTGCSSPGDGKIPITTESRTALKYFIEGRDLAESFQNIEALANFELAIEADTAFAMAYYYKAITQIGPRGFLENFQKAKSHLNQVSEGERLMILGLDAQVNRDPVQVEKYYTKLVELYAADERAHTLLGTYYYGQQEYDKAIDELYRAIDADPDYSQPYNMLGYSYRLLKMTEKSEDAFLKYINLIPDNPNPYDSYAELLLEQGEFEESIRNYKKALAINKSFIPSHIGIASNFILMNQHSRARRQLQKLLDLVPSYGAKRQARFARATCYVDEERFDKALEEISEAMTLAEKAYDTAAFAGDQALYGNYLLESGEIKQARQKYKESLKLAESSSLSDQIKENNRYNIMYNLARSDAAEGKFAQAKDKAEQFSQRADKVENPALIRQARQLDGIIALGEKKYDQALKFLEQSNQLNPYNIFRMAQAWHGKGDLEQARLFYQRASGFNVIINNNYSYIRQRAHKLAGSL